MTCGAGEAVIVWSLETGTVQHCLRLNQPKSCNLATHCLMACAWITGEDNGEEEERGRGSHACIVSGGYDGKVTRWSLGHNKMLT